MLCSSYFSSDSASLPLFVCLFPSLPPSNLAFWSYAGKNKERRGQTLFYSNPKPWEQTQIQPNRIYSRVPLQMGICRLSIGLGPGASGIDTQTTTKLRKNVGKEEMLTSCCSPQRSTSGIAPSLPEIQLDFTLFDRMSFRCLRVGILNSGGVMRTMVNCSSDLGRVNPDS